MTIPFWKVESIGNDFVLVHLADAERLSGGRLEEFLPALAIRACARRYGVGSDGLLVTWLAGEAVMLRMFNPDGSEDFCGNGIRCAFAHAFSQGWIGEQDALIRHLGEDVVGSVRSGAEGDFLVSFTLPPATYEPSAIPLDSPAPKFDAPLFTIEGREYRGSVLSTGTAHTVIPMGALPDDQEFLRVGPLIENHSIFPERTSVMWVQTSGPEELRVRIWERGAGETLGCGTGSTAVAIDAMRRNGQGGRYRVVNPGGVVEVIAGSWSDPPLVVGSAREVFRGELECGRQLGVTT